MQHVLAKSFDDRYITKVCECKVVDPGLNGLSSIVASLFGWFLGRDLDDGETVE